MTGGMWLCNQAAVWVLLKSVERASATSNVVRLYSVEMSLGCVGRGVVAPDTFGWCCSSFEAAGDNRGG
jgi:hypothetical protein